MRQATTKTGKGPGLHSIHQSCLLPPTGRQRQGSLTSGAESLVCLAATAVEQVMHARGEQRLRLADALLGAAEISLGSEEENQRQRTSDPPQAATSLILDAAGDFDVPALSSPRGDSTPEALTAAAAALRFGASALLSEAEDKQREVCASSEEADAFAKLPIEQILNQLLDGRAPVQQRQQQEPHPRSEQPPPREEPGEVEFFKAAEGTASAGASDLPSAQPKRTSHEASCSIYTFECVDFTPVVRKVAKESRSSVCTDSQAIELLARRRKADSATAAGEVSAMHLFFAPPTTRAPKASPWRRCLTRVFSGRPRRGSFRGGLCPARGEASPR